MILADYHLHTEFSPDSTEPIENLCEKAVAEGISEVALTDHCEFPLMERTPWPDFGRRNAVIDCCREKYAGRLTIRKGVELGQPYYDLPLMKELIEREPFDFVIASVHHLQPGLDYKEIEITEENFRELFEDYLRNTRLLLDTAEYDVVGHIDYFYKYCSPELVKKYPPELFADKYAEIFTYLADKGKGIEINCSGLRMPSVQDTLPSVSLLNLFRECGGKTVTVGSDGHSCRSYFSGIEQGYANLKAAGFDCVARFKDREVSYVQI